jgi:hypothetical protein
MMHTIYDQIISPAMGVVNFDNRVTAACKGDNLTVFYTALKVTVTLAKMKHEQLLMLFGSGLLQK